MTVPRPEIALYDPALDVVTEVWDTIDHPPGVWPSGHRLYCSGHSVLPDGRVVFRGGDQDPGNALLSIYDQVSGNAGFVPGPDELIDFLQYQDKQTYRWYPTNTAMPDGRVLITDGWEKANIIYPPPPNPGDPPPPPYPATDWPHGNANIPVIFDPAQPPATAYTALTSAEYCQQTANGQVPPLGEYGENCNASAPNVFNMEEYPWMFLVSNGKVFYSRSQYGTPTDTGSRRGRLLNTTGLGQWTDLGTGADAPIMGGCAVMYAKDRILMTGGATVPHFSGC